MDMDFDGYARFVLALVFVLGLIGVVTALARRLGLGYRPATGRSRRLAIAEVLTLDARHRLVLVRRDGTEHLLLLGHQADVVVETGIAPPAPLPEPPAETGRFADRLAAATRGEAPR